VTPALAHLVTDARGFGWLPEDDFVRYFAADVDPVQHIMTSEPTLTYQVYVAPIIRDFDRLDQQTATAEDLYWQMLAIHPHRVNPGALWLSAQSVKA
jgi:hypothetical protein